MIRKGKGQKEDLGDRKGVFRESRSGLGTIWARKVYFGVGGGFVGPFGVGEGGFEQSRRFGVTQKGLGKIGARKMNFGAHLWPRRRNLGESNKKAF